MNEKQIKIFPTVDELNLFAANQFVRLCAAAIEKRGQFTVALSGGSTPKKLNTLLASDAFRPLIDWSKVQFFWGDERSVWPTHEDSNYRMANEMLLSKVDIPGENIHRFLTEQGDSETAAMMMAAEIQRFFKLEKGEFPQFDLIFLGMGPDGHTASLFPETAALKEEKRIVTENYVPKFETFRLTFTVPTINNARHIIFLIAGADKAEALHEVLEGEPNPEKFPSQFIRPENGDLLFLVDENAATDLKKRSAFGLVE